MHRVSVSAASRTQSILLACGVCAGPLFVTLFLIEGATRPGYDPLRHAVSSLSIGASGWVQTANFLVTGTLVIAFATGLLRQIRSYRPSFWGPALIGLTGVGLVGAGLFVSDPIYGYPSELPHRLAQFTVHGHLHDLFSMFFFISLPSACLVFARRFWTIGDRGWATYSIVTAAAMVIVFALTAAGFKQVTALVGVAGLLQRLTIVIGLTWLTSLAALHAGCRDRRRSL
jgi:hypothetical membrane protein